MSPDRVGRTIVVAVTCLVIALSGCGASSEAGDETCAETGIGAGETSGDELVAFCRDHYEPALNGEVCDPVLNEAGIEPDTLPPALAMGTSTTVEIANGDRLKLRAQRVVDPISGKAADQPQAGSRYIGVVARVSNVGDSDVYELATAQALLSRGPPVESSPLAKGKCSRATIDLARGRSALMCFPFEVADGRRIKRFQLRIGGGDFVARWEM